MGKGGPRAGAGRPKGAKDRLPREAKEYILTVAQRLESEGKGLYEWALSNPDGFWGKMYRAITPKPVEISGANGSELELLSSRQLEALLSKLLGKDSGNQDTSGAPDERETE